MKVAFIGCGGHAKTSLYPLLPGLGFDLAATCATSLANAQDTAARFGADGAYDDVERMLKEVRPEAVLVAVPPTAYADIVRACVAAGVPAFLEKPGATSADEARALASLAEQAGVPVMVGYMKRFAPAYQQARECLQRGDFGAPTLATFTFVMGPFGTDFDSYLVDNPVHHLDLARFLLGELIDVSARSRTSAEGRHALTVSARAADSGALVSLQLGSTGSWWQRNESVEVFGTGSSLFVDNVDTCTLRPPARPEQVWRPNYTVPFAQNLTGTTMGFAPELAHFRSVVADGLASESDLLGAARTLDLVAAVQAAL